jgi:hypothetical protein
VTEPTQYPISGGVEPSDCTSLDQAYFLRLFDRSYPLGYLLPLKTTPNSGYELFQAMSKMGERISSAASELDCDSIIVFSLLGAKAKGTISITRPTAAAGAVTISAGSLVSTSDGREFQLDQDVAFGAADLGPHTVSVTAVATGFEYNVPGQVTAANGEVLPGEINQFSKLVTVPVFADTSFVVSQPSPTTGGRSAMLESLGHDRGIEYAGEPIDLYRFKIRSLPDVVSPGAIIRLLNSIGGVNTFCFREVGSLLLRGAFYDGDRVSGSPAAVPLSDFYDENVIVFDGALVVPGFLSGEVIELRDPQNLTIGIGYFGQLQNANTRLFFVPKNSGSQKKAGAGYSVVGTQSGARFDPTSVVSTASVINPRRFRLQFDYASFRGFFLIGVPRLSDGEFGVCYDTHPFNAYDTQNSKYPNFMDGFASAASKFYASVFSQVSAIKAAGVGFDLYFEDIGCP